MKSTGHIPYEINNIPKSAYLFDNSNQQFFTRIFNNYYILTEDYIFSLGRKFFKEFKNKEFEINKDGELKIYAGFKWDGETCVFDLNIEASLIHDILCKYYKITEFPLDREDIDFIYYEIYRCNKLWYYRNIVARIRYAGIRLFGKFYN